MADQDKTAGASTAPGSTSTQSRPASGSTGTPQVNRKQDDPGAGVVLGMQTVTGIGADLKAAHEARVTVAGAPGVDARLDNRQGADRPPLETYPAKPQQIDGPDVAGQVEHTRRTLAQRGDATGRKGMFSPGPHGISSEALRQDENVFSAEETGSKAGR